MLFQQHTTDYVGFIHHSVSKVDHYFDRFFESDGDCLRTGDIAVWLDRGSLVPQQEFPSVFFFKQHYSLRRIKLAKAISKRNACFSFGISEGLRVCNCQGMACFL